MLDMDCVLLELQTEVLYLSQMNISCKRVNSVQIVCILGSFLQVQFAPNAGSLYLFQVLIINVGQEFTNKWMNSLYI